METERAYVKCKDCMYTYCEQWFSRQDFMPPFFATHSATAPPLSSIYSVGKRIA